MITLLRKRLIQNKLYKIIVWSMVIMMAASLGLPGILKQAGIGNWVVEINGHEVGYHDYARHVISEERHLQFFKKQYGEHAETLIKMMGLNFDPNHLALQKIIKDTLLNQQVAALGLFIHDSYKDDKMGDMFFVLQELADLIPPAALNAQGINMQRLRVHLKQMHMSMSTLDDHIMQVLERDLIKQLIHGAIYLSRQELIDAYQREYAPKKYTLLTIVQPGDIDMARLDEIKAASSLKPFSVLAREYHGTLETIDSLAGSATERIKVLHDRGLPVEQMLALSRQGSVTMSVDYDKKNIYVAQLNLVAFDQADFDQKKQTLIQRLLQEKERLHMSSFVASLYRTATIKQNESIINPQKEYSA